MKKKAMKKWIPKGHYCYGIRQNKTKGKKCKWFKHIKTIINDEKTCIYAKECLEEYGMCYHCPKFIYRCEYLKYTDTEQESLLWDSCKECGVKEY